MYCWLIFNILKVENFRLSRSLHSTKRTKVNRIAYSVRRKNALSHARSKYHLKKECFSTNFDTLNTNPMFIFLSNISFVFSSLYPSHTLTNKLVFQRCNLVYDILRWIILFQFISMVLIIYLKEPHFWESFYFFRMTYLPKKNS